MICKDHHRRPYEFRRWALRVWEAQDHDGVSGALARACLVLLARDWEECPLDFSVETHTCPGFYCYPDDKMWNQILEGAARHAIVDPVELRRKDGPIAPVDLSEFDEAEDEDQTDVSVFSRLENDAKQVAQQQERKQTKPRVRLVQVDGKRVSMALISQRQATKGNGWLARLFRRVGDL